MQEFYETLSAQKDGQDGQFSWLNRVSNSSREQINVLTASVLSWFTWD